MDREIIYADLLKVANDSGIFLYPTDTIWGLGCNALNAVAVDKIYALKQRKKEKPFILLLDNIEHLKKYVPDLHPRIETLLSHHTKPLTVIYKKSRNIPEYLLAEDGSIAIRLTRDPFCQDLIRIINAPIVSTSANIAGSAAPKNFIEIEQTIKDHVDYVVPLRQNERKSVLPSVIAKLNAREELEFIRT